MFVLTVDQVDSQGGSDLVEPALAEIARIAGGELLRPAERTAGDELQAATASAATALDLVLALSRPGTWSIGLGIGGVRHPLPDSTRAMAGSAFVNARAAIEAAKRRPTRFAAVVEGDGLGGDDLTALVDLLLQLRGRRSVPGWELYELLAAGATQAEAAARLGITPQAASLRATAAQLKTDFAAQHALERVLELADTEGKAP